MSFLLRKWRTVVSHLLSCSQFFYFYFFKKSCLFQDTQYRRYNEVKIQQETRAWKPEKFIAKQTFTAFLLSDQQLMDTTKENACLKSGPFSFILAINITVNKTRQEQIVYSSYSRMKTSNKRHTTKPLCKLKDSKEVQMKFLKHLVKSLSAEIKPLPTGTMYLEGFVKWHLPFQEDVKTNIQFVSWNRPSAVKSSHIKRTEGLVPN